MGMSPAHEGDFEHRHSDAGALGAGILGWSTERRLHIITPATQHAAPQI